MAHKFHGIWRSFTIDDVSQEARGDGQIDLRINEGTGDVSAGSNHDGKSVTGRATTTAAGVRRLDLEQADIPRKQFGLLLSEKDATGREVLVVIGRYQNQHVPIPSPETVKKRAAIAVASEQQDEGTWVIIK